MCAFYGRIFIASEVTNVHRNCACACECMRSGKGKGKGMVLYSAVSSPLDRSKRFTLSSPGRPVHSDTVLGFSWKHSSHAAIAQRLFTHISTTVYSQVLIYTAESTEASWSERKCPNFETVTTGFEPGLSRLRVRHSTNWATALHGWTGARRPTRRKQYTNA